MNHYGSLNSLCTTTEKNIQFLLKINWNNTYVNSTEEPAALRQGSVMLQKYVKGSKILSMFLEAFLLFLSLPIVWIACTALKLFYLHKSVKALGPPEHAHLASTSSVQVMLLGYCFKDARTLYLFLQMRKLSTKQGRATSEEPCSEPEPKSTVS